MIERKNIQVLTSTHEALTKKMAYSDTWDGFFLKLLRQSEELENIEQFGMNEEPPAIVGFMKEKIKNIKEKR